MGTLVYFIKSYNYTARCAIVKHSTAPTSKRQKKYLKNESVETTSRMVHDRTDVLVFYTTL